MLNCARQASREIFRTWLVLYAAPHPHPVDEYSAASGNNRGPAHHYRAAITRATGANDTPGAHDRIGVGRLEGHGAARASTAAAISKNARMSISLICPC